MDGRELTGVPCWWKPQIYPLRLQGRLFMGDNSLEAPKVHIKSALGKGS